MLEKYEQNNLQNESILNKYEEMRNMYVIN